MRHRRTNWDLPPLPNDDAVIDAVREIVAENEAKMERAREIGRPYYRWPGATANNVAYQLRIQPARRLGNGAVKGSWSGTMSAATRIAPRLRSLARRGLLDAIHDPDGGYRWVYTVPE